MTLEGLPAHNTVNIPHMAQTDAASDTEGAAQLSTEMLATGTRTGSSFPGPDPCAPSSRPQPCFALGYALIFLALITNIKKSFYSFLEGPEFKPESAVPHETSKADLSSAR